MKRFLVSVLALACFGAQSAQALVSESECTPKDSISKQLGPVHEQGTSGMCYAFVAADMITCNQGIGPQNRVSPIDVGYNMLAVDPEQVRKDLTPHTPADLSGTIAKSLEGYKLRKGLENVWDRLQNGQAIHAIVSYNLGKGICLEKDLPAEGTAAGIDADHYLGYRISQMQMQNPINDVEFATVTSRRGMCFDPQYTADLTPPQISEMVVKIGDLAYAKWGAVVDEACKKRLPVKKMSTVYAGVPVPFGNLGALFNKVLDSDVPVGISVNSGFLKGGSTYPMSQESDHAMLVVGRRWNSHDKVCEFKVRNSWGPSCDLYHADFKKNCDAGNIWFTETELQKRVSIIQAIEKQESK